MTSVAAVLSAKYLLLITIFANVQIASGDACGHGAARNAARDVHGELKSVFLARGVSAVLTLVLVIPVAAALRKGDVAKASALIIAVFVCAFICELLGRTIPLDASVPLRDVIHYFAIPQTF
ncbi:hypothetical protein [Candidatus Alkanophaga liquidiphilum]